MMINYSVLLQNLNIMFQLHFFEKSPIYYLFWLAKFLTYTYL